MTYRPTVLSSLNIVSGDMFTIKCAQMSTIGLILSTANEPYLEQKSCLLIIHKSEPNDEINEEEDVPELVVLNDTD